VNVLLVEDEDRIASFVEKGLGTRGFEVRRVITGGAALDAISDDVDIVVLDLGLPDIDGLEVLRSLRKAWTSLPVVILTARGDIDDRVAGLDLGADDYVPKPFSTRVLLARLNVLLRRGTHPPEPPVRAGRLTIDGGRMQAKWDEHPIDLTVTELRVLEALARRPGYVLSRGRLLELARGDDSVVGDRLIDTYVRRIRRKLEAIDAAFDRIETIVGAGYRWRAS